jgi:hypothetical protein
MNNYKYMINTNDTEWLEEASCVKNDLDLNLFFPKRKSDFSIELYEMCYLCPVRMKCLNFVSVRETDKTDEMHKFGFFGGLSPDDRQELYKNQPEKWETISKVMIINNIERRKAIELNKKRKRKVRKPKDDE